MVAAGEAHLLNLSIAALRQRAGYGSLLLREAAEHARSLRRAQPVPRGAAEQPRRAGALYALRLPQGRGAPRATIRRSRAARTRWSSRCRSHEPARRAARRDGHRAHLEVASESRLPRKRPPRLDPAKSRGFGLRQMRPAQDAHANRVRRRRRERRLDADRRGAGRGRGPARRSVRRPGGKAARQHARRDRALAPQERLHRQRAQVPAAGQPQSRRRRKWRSAARISCSRSS